MKKSIIIAIVALVVVALVVGGIFIIKGQSSKQNSIVGTWKNDEYGYDFIYTFNEDGTGKYDAAGTIMEFTYKTEGNNISILYSGDTIALETQYEINGDVLNVIDSLGGDTFYQKVK